MQRQYIIHPIPPTFDENSEILILGSFPSSSSREMGYYYGHPRNRFWKVMAALYGEAVPAGVDERRSFLLRNRVAAWDVISSCTIMGSSDSSIRDVTANDLRPILSGSSVQKIYVNGKTAEKMYRRYIEPSLGISAVCLPSTSPANAAYTLDRLIEEWKEAIGGQHLKEDIKCQRR